MTRKKKKNYDMSSDDAKDIKKREIDKAIEFANGVDLDGTTSSTSSNGFDSHVKNSILQHIEEFKEVDVLEAIGRSLLLVKDMSAEVLPSMAPVLGGALVAAPVAAFAAPLTDAAIPSFKGKNIT